MEKRFNKNKPKYRKIVLTGPESTGKTWLAKQLARHYQTDWISEYAREYVENLKRKYNYSDLVVIAQYQVNVMKDYTGKVNRFLFFDTDLIILKVWFDVVYNECPAWLTESIDNRNIDLYLLCDTDIKWEYDPVRENADQNREVLIKMYKQEILNSGVPFVLIRGKDSTRLSNAVNAIEEWNRGNRGEDWNSQRVKKD